MKILNPLLAIIAGIPFILSILISTKIIIIPDATDFYLIDNPEGQAQLKSKLEEHKIPISSDEKGRIFYESKYSDLVQKLAKEVLSSSPPSTTSLRYSIHKYTELLIDKLKTNNICYSIEYIKNEKHINLSYKDKENWLPIRQEVDNLFIQEQRNHIKQTKDKTTTSAVKQQPPIECY